MSNSSPSPQQDEPLESDVVFGDTPSLNEETPILPDPLPKSDPETLPSAPPIPDPDENSPEEEDDDDEEGEEIDEETTPAVSASMDLRIEPPITDLHVSAPDVTLASPTGRRGGAKRKKGKGKGKGKSNAKKLQHLRLNLHPIPFIPHKILDFAHHENLLRKLGLWEFVHIDFDRTIRVDFIAQLVANYNVKLRCSYVNEYRIMVNRPDLARSLKLPLKKEKGNAGVAELDLDWEDMPDDSIGFMLEFFSDWVLLHEDEDMWMMPKEVADWMKLIREGHPEKVDWAGLLWFMVEKELKQGGQLRDCYYASHLQHLIKFQREDVFLIEEPAKGEEGESAARAMGVVDGDDDVFLIEESAKGEEVELASQAKEVEDDGDDEGNVKDSDAVESTVEGREGDLVVEGPSTELTLGQDGETEEVKDGVEGEGVKDVEMMDGEKCKDSDEERGLEEQEQWLLNGKNNLGEHFIQRCSAENAEEFGSFEDRKDEEEEEEEMDAEEEDEDDVRNNFHVFPNDDGLEGDDDLEGDAYTGNFLQGLEGNQLAFSSHEQLRNASSVDARVDVQHIASTPSFFNNSGKRVIEHDYHDAVNDNKRLRINETWGNKPVDFGMCMEQIQQMAQQARMLYEEKEQAVEQSSMNQQMLLDELQKRDTVIEHLHKARVEDSQKKDMAINRLERELYLMGSVLDGYRKAYKDTRKAFAEYKERAQLPEESTYKDVGPGGLMLTAAEIERHRKRREEEFKMNCLFLDQKMREVGEEYSSQFEEHLDRVNLLDKRLIGLEADAKELIALHSKRKIPPTEETLPEVAEALPVPEPEEEEAVPEEVSEPLPVPVPEEEEAVLEEVSVPIPVPEPEEQVPEAEAEAADHQQSPQTDEKVFEVADPLSVE